MVNWVMKNEGRLSLPEINGYQYVTRFFYWRSIYDPS